MTEDRWSSMGRPGTWQRHECPECGGPEYRTLGSGYAHKVGCSKREESGASVVPESRPGTGAEPAEEVGRVRSAESLGKTRLSGRSPLRTQSDAEQDRQARDARNGECECGSTHWWSCPNNPYSEVGQE